MPKPKIHADAAARNRAAQAAHQARQRALSPLERLAGQGHYTPEEQGLLDLLRLSIAQAEDRAAALNAILLARVTEDPDFPRREEILDRLQNGLTQVTLRWF